MHQNLDNDFTAFIEGWTDDSKDIKTCFLALHAHLESLDGIKLEFVPRPGITYSLRAAHVDQKARALFAMVDVIDDDPTDRWLSVCFYDELVDDPDELGDEVPGGLMGEDARCFDLDEADDKRLAYIKARLASACASAANEG